MNAVIPYDQKERLAASLVKSRMFGLENVDQAMALMCIAEAEGKHPAIIARDFHIIQGRAAKKAESMMRDLLQSGGSVKWHELTDQAADATFSHPQGGSIRIRWDMERAAQAGLTQRGDMYKKYPRQMLRSRCVSEGVRTVCPLATSGVYTPEEVQDMVNETPADGPIDVTPVKPVLTVELIAEHVTAMKQTQTLEDLKSAYRTAYSAAKSAGDVGALEEFERTKDHRKAALEMLGESDR